MGQHCLNSGAGSASQYALQDPSSDDGTGRGRTQHAGHPFDIGILARRYTWLRHRARNEPCILAAEEHRHEFRSGLGNDRNPVSALRQPTPAFAPSQRPLRSSAISKDMLNRPLAE